jgi:ATP-binding cassette, subfamily B, bacterial MsbA
VNQLQRLFGYARPYRGRFAAAIAAMALYAAGTLLALRQIEPLMDEVLIGESVLGTRTRLVQWSIALVAAYLLKGLGAYASTFLMTDVGQRVVRDLRNQLFGHILGQSAAFFSRRTTGQLMSRITNDVNQVQQAVSETLGDLMREGLTLVALAGYLFFLDWRWRSSP